MFREAVQLNNRLKIADVNRLGFGLSYSASEVYCTQIHYSLLLWTWPERMSAPIAAAAQTQLQNAATYSKREVNTCIRI